jgi:hypothetical protein
VDRFRYESSETVGNEANSPPEDLSDGRSVEQSEDDTIILDRRLNSEFWILEVIPEEMAIRTHSRLPALT